MVDSLQMLQITFQCVNKGTVEHLADNIAHRGRGAATAILRRKFSGLRLPLTPITTIRSAPKCNAGLIGAIWRMAPSPKYSRSKNTAGNTVGIADEANRWSTVNTLACPTRRAGASLVNAVRLEKRLPSRRSDNLRPSRIRLLIHRV